MNISCRDVDRTWKGDCVLKCQRVPRGGEDNDEKVQNEGEYELNR